MLAIMRLCPSDTLHPSPPCPVSSRLNVNFISEHSCKGFLLHWPMGSTGSMSVRPKGLACRLVQIGCVLLPRATGLSCGRSPSCHDHPFSLLETAPLHCPFRPVVVTAPSGCCSQGPALSLTDFLKPCLRLH